MFLLQSLTFLKLKIPLKPNQTHSTSDIALAEIDAHTDISNPDAINSNNANSDGEGKVKATTVNTDHSRLKLEEKKKLFWKDKTHAQEEIQVCGSRFSVK